MTKRGSFATELLNRGWLPYFFVFRRCMHARGGPLSVQFDTRVFVSLLGNAVGRVWVHNAVVGKGTVRVL
jgi:hypothetical protein